MLDVHTREPITVITQRYLGVLRFCRWSQPGRHQKSALFLSEIRMERSHSVFCTNCHKIDITTGYCSWVELHPYKKKQWNLVCFGDINRRTKIAWGCFRKFFTELFDRPSVPLRLKARLLKAEAMEALLYGCMTWATRNAHYRQLRTTHHKLLLRVIGYHRVHGAY